MDAFQSWELGPALGMLSKPGVCDWTPALAADAAWPPGFAPGGPPFDHLLVSTTPIDGSNN
ncbi:hypothetical protein BpHYR1_022642 [Brachionus plicatilis]|uniref:Uncharacterized protein n=1 Tax=Brachionus plicatilis TaxID=10195 RepID=A0A3M7QFT2_BRAPC|nr:hypothetical protein BpHYR1_022642 [Brachionus plicatilis]